ncbi:hypothetical protein ES703_102318 [subsurface metagenome]
MAKVLNRGGLYKPIAKGAVLVARPSKWGNPYKIGRDGDRLETIKKYREYILNNAKLLACLPELKGKDLVCYCAPLPCHADVLLELANNR